LTGGANEGLGLGEVVVGGGGMQALPSAFITRPSWNQIHKYLLIEKFSSKVNLFMKDIFLFSKQLYFFALNIDYSAISLPLSIQNNKSFFIKYPQVANLT